MRHFILIPIAFGMFANLSASGYAAEGDAAMGHAMHHNQHTMDNRISLGLSPAMKQHQLENMRSHLAAIQSIVGYLSDNKFEQAADVAHTKLGLTDEMEKMCSTMSDNEQFTRLGLAFHNSGDDLGNTLKTGDMKMSLRALRNTMESCVQCHATFRQ